MKKSIEEYDREDEEIRKETHRKLDALSKKRKKYIAQGLSTSVLRAEEWGIVQEGIRKQKDLIARYKKDYPNGR